jgi:hypothetical protein
LAAQPAPATVSVNLIFFFIGGLSLNGNTIFFFNKLQILDRIVIFGLAVAVIIEFDFRNIELNQAP